MAADNVSVTAGSGTIIRSLSDGTNEWPAGVLAWPTTISAGANVLQLVDGSHGLPVNLIAGTAGQGAAAAVAAAWPIKLTDATNTVTVFQTHNADNQSLGGAAYAINTGGVAQLLNASGNIDRQRETGADGVSSAGIASGTQQLASPFSTTSATGPLTAGTRTFTVLSITGFQVGGTVILDAGAALELATITAVAGSTFTCVTTKTHDGSGTPFAVKTFTYNQARDATNPEGSTGVGIPLGATTLYNAALNSPSGGWENERSFLGELSGATGKGSAVAVEFEDTSGGPLLASGLPSGMRLMPAVSLLGKGTSGALAITSTTAGDANLTLAGGVAAGKSLPAGAAILLSGSGTAEVVFTTVVWTPGSSATVPLQSPVVNTGQTTARWDVFAANGPGLAGFSPSGLGIEEECVFAPSTNLYYIERAADADGVSNLNVVMESPALMNGSGTMDREYNAHGDAILGTVLGDGRAPKDRSLESEVSYLYGYNGTNWNRARLDALNNLVVAAAASPVGGASKFKAASLGAAVSVKAAAGTLLGVTVTNGSAAIAFVQVFDLLVGGVTLGTTVPDEQFTVAVGATVTLPLPATGVLHATGIALAATTTQGGATPSAANVYATAFYA